MTSLYGGIIGALSYSAYQAVNATGERQYNHEHLAAILTALLLIGVTLDLLRYWLLRKEK